MYIKEGFKNCSWQTCTNGRWPVYPNRRDCRVENRSSLPKVCLARKRVNQSSAWTLLQSWKWWVQTGRGSFYYLIHAVNRLDSFLSISIFKTKKIYNNRHNIDMLAPAGIVDDVPFKGSGILVTKCWVRLKLSTRLLTCSE